MKKKGKHLHHFSFNQVACKCVFDILHVLHLKIVEAMHVYIGNVSGVFNKVKEIVATSLGNPCLLRFVQLKVRQIEICVFWNNPKSDNDLQLFFFFQYSYKMYLYYFESFAWKCAKNMHHQLVCISEYLVLIQRLGRKGGVYIIIISIKSQWICLTIFDISKEFKRFVVMMKVDFLWNTWQIDYIRNFKIWIASLTPTITACSTDQMNRYNENSWKVILHRHCKFWTY